MKEQVTITLTDQEALMVVTALGTYQNRIGQHTSWTERKRIPTLQRLAQDAETETDINAIQQKLEREQRYIARCINNGKLCNELKERIKREAGITNQRMLDYAQ